MNKHLFLPSLTQVQSDGYSLDDPGEQKVISLLTEVIEQIRKENQELSDKQAQAQVNQIQKYFINPLGGLLNILWTVYFYI